MAAEIPQFLLDMSEQLNTQDNRITADPLFQVCYDRETITAEGYEEYTQWCVMKDEGIDVVFSNQQGSAEDNEHAKNYLLEHFPDYCNDWASDNEESFDMFDFTYATNWLEFPAKIEALHMCKRREVVKSCLTEKDAQWFINRKQHDYPKLYIYACSMCYCPQMIALRKWIMELT